MSSEPWYQELFGEDYLRVWEPSIPPERTEQELTGILDLLQLPPGSRILDLCCGHGRHAIPLAARGYRVTGQDLSELFLRRGGEEAAAAGVDVEWVHSDMRTIPFTDELDAVINIFTAFGYLETEDEDQQVLHAIHGALKPGGRFLLEVGSREGLVRRFGPHSITRHEDGLVVLEERRFDLLASRSETRMTLLHPDGSRREYRHAVRMYSLTELAKMLAKASLSLEAYHGGLDGSELTLESRRLAVIARK